MKNSTGSLPIFRGLEPGGGSLSANIVAGFTLAALAIPEVMGYTRISGTPVITGLYTMLIPVALFAFFGSSRHLVVGADSATAAILAAGIGGMAVRQSDEWVALAGLLALMAAAFLFIARVARLGFLANFLSRTVLIGFLSSVGVQVALGALPGMFGIRSDGPGVVAELSVIVVNLVHLGALSGATVIISAAVLLLILGSRMVSRKIPGAMIAVVASILVTWAFGLGNRGVSILGAIPKGLPHLGFPQVALSFQLVERLIPTAFAMFVVILTQSAATSRAYAERRGEQFSENVDLVGLGIANIGAGLSGTFVVNGSPTKTQMVSGAGGTSQLAQITTSIVVLAVLLFLTGPLAFLPTAVLSTVVFLIGIELIDIKGLHRISVERPYEFWVALITAGTVVFVGVEQSILLAIVLSLVVHTRHGYLVNNVLLVTGESGWHPNRVDTAAQAEPGLIIYRFLHNMYYANTYVLRRDIATLVAQARPGLRWLCIDLAAVNDVDFTAAEALRTLHGDLGEKGIRLVFSELVENCRSGFIRSGLTELFGTDAFFPTLDSVIKEYRTDAAKR